MKRNMLVVAAVGASLLTAVATLAQTSDPAIQYWGLWQGSDRGVIRLQDQYYTIGKGDQIPGVGTVQDFTNEALIVERLFTPQEKEDMEAKGQKPIDGQIRRIPNLGSRLGPSLLRPIPAPTR